MIRKRILNYGKNKEEGHTQVSDSLVFRKHFLQSKKVKNLVYNYGAMAEKLKCTEKHGRFVSCKDKK